MGFAFASIILMTADHRYHYLEGVRAGLSLVVYPLRYVVDLPAAAGGWLAEHMAVRQALIEENARLRDDHLLLRARQQKLEALEEENRRLRKLLESSSKAGERVLVAELMAVELDPYKQQVILNKGSRHGVYPDQPLIDADGIMGQIVEVGPLTSVALLISDSGHALPVQLNRTGLRTIAVGTGEADRLELPYLSNNADVEEGDLLVTSGLGGHFPPDYPVGTIAKVEHDPSQPFAVVSATPSAHLDRSREVLLVWPNGNAGPPREEQRFADGEGETAPPAVQPAAPPAAAAGAKR